MRRSRRQGFNSTGILVVYIVPVVLLLLWVVCPYKRWK